MPNTWPIAKGPYYGHAGLIVALGIWYLASPDWFYGPSWSYFPYLPHNGFGIGTTMVALGSAQLWAIRRDRVCLAAHLLWLGGFVCWTAGILLAAEGLLGHQGLQEAPLFCIIGGYKFIVSSTLIVHCRSQNRGDS